MEQEDRFGFKHSRGLLGLISARHAIDIKTITDIAGKTYVAEDVETIKTDLQKRMGTTFDITMQRGEKIDVLTISPVQEFNSHMDEEDHAKHGLLFVSDRDGSTFVRYSAGKAVIKALEESWDVTVSTVEALGQIITGTRSAAELGGVIRIGALAGDMAQQGAIALILFTALLSINLGLINLFPIPLLDGGHLVFYAFEALLGRPVPEQIQEYAFRFGLVFLVGIMVFANLNDLIQLIL